MIVKSAYHTGPEDALTRRPGSPCGNDPSYASRRRKVRPHGLPGLPGTTLRLTQGIFGRFEGKLYAAAR